MSKEPVKTGWAITRVSTKDQAEVQHGSLEQQEHAINGMIESLNKKAGAGRYKLARVIREAQSGRASSVKKRSEYQELLSAIERKEIQFVVFEKLDRVNRDVIENKRLMQLADKYGVEVWEVESGQKIDLTDRGIRLAFNLKNMWAEEYSLDLEEKITKKQRSARVHNGKDTQTVPILGLDPHPTRVGIYVINENDQIIVQDIFETYLRLRSLKLLAEHCKEKGYLTKVRVTKQKVDQDGNIVPSRRLGGIPFDSVALERHLSNPKYLGHAYFDDSKWKQFTERQETNGMVRWNYAHGPVIDEKLFFDVQSVLARNKERYARPRVDGETYLLSGLLCSSAGQRLNGASAKGGKNHYYELRTDRLRISKAAIEKVVIDRLRGYVNSTGILERLVDGVRSGTSDKKLDFQLSAVVMEERRLQAALNGYESTMRDAAARGENLLEVVQLIVKDREAVARRLEELQQQRRGLEVAKEMLAGQDLRKRVMERAREILDSSRTGTRAALKALIQCFFDKIIIHPGNRLELVVNLAPDLLVNGRQKFVCDQNGSPSASQIADVSSTIYLTDMIDFQYVFPLTDRNFLHQKYVVEGLSRRQIAELTASSRATVTRYLHLHNIATAHPERRTWQHPGQLPYGTRLHHGRVVPNKAELRVIKRMCDLRARGMTYREIAASLEASQIPTKTGRLNWAATTIMKLVSKASIG